MFETVASVEYKRLDDEKSQDQNDSLEDITVSLNDPKSSKHVQIVLDGEPLNNNNIIVSSELQYIDEDQRPKMDMNSNNGLTCDDCIGAGHNKSTKEQDENKVRASNILIEEQSLDASNNEIAEESESAKTDININGDQMETSLARPKIILQTVANDEEKRDNNDVSSAARKDSVLSIVSTSKMSVTSIASGESGGSFSFSADSLG